jgi:putative membrane protein
MAACAAAHMRFNFDRFSSFRKELTMRKRLCIVLVATTALLAASSLPGLSQSKTGKDERHDFSKVTDEQFAQMAEQINLTEIAAGNQAASKAKRSEIQEFGKMMVKDHTEANRKLAAAVKDKNRLTGKLDAKHQAKVDKLTGLTANEFDRAYIQEMVEGHKMAAELFEHQATNGKDANLKAYASEILPGVRKHLQKAQQISKDSAQGAGR